MKLAGDASRGQEQAGPAISVQAVGRRSLEEVACKVAGNSELLGQLRAVERQAPVKQIPQL